MVIHQPCKVRITALRLRKFQVFVRPTNALCKHFGLQRSCSEGFVGFLGLANDFRFSVVKSDCSWHRVSPKPVCDLRRCVTGGSIKTRRTRPKFAEASYGHRSRTRTALAISSMRTCARSHLEILYFRFATHALRPSASRQAGRRPDPSRTSVQSERIGRWKGWFVPIEILRSQQSNPTQRPHRRSAGVPSQDLLVLPEVRDKLPDAWDIDGGVHVGFFEKQKAYSDYHRRNVSGKELLG